MKTKEELNALKKEFQTLNAKLAELSNDELLQVAGGSMNKSELVPNNGVIWLKEESFDNYGM